MKKTSKNNIRKYKTLNYIFLGIVLLTAIMQIAMFIILIINKIEVNYVLSFLLDIITIYFAIGAFKFKAFNFKLIGIIYISKFIMNILTDFTSLFNPLDLTSIIDNVILIIIAVISLLFARKFSVENIEIQQHET